MPYIRRIVVVCGYGCNLDSPLKSYLDRVLAWCTTHRPDAIILCGGATQQTSFPHQTEAKVMREYLGPLEPLYHPQWAILGASYTTYENISDAAAVIATIKARPWYGSDPRHDEITIFCEATRALKVAILARHFLGFPPAKGEPDIRIETGSWERMHPVKELAGTVQTWLATKFPVLNTWQSRKVRAKSVNR